MKPRDTNRDLVWLSVALAVLPTAVVIGLAVELLGERSKPVISTSAARPPAASTPIELGAALFHQSCEGCHLPYNSVRATAPRLDGYLSESWLFRLLQNPDDPAFFGRTKSKSGMDSYRGLGEEKVAALAGFLAHLRDADRPETAERLEAGRALFREAGCDGCHSLAAGEISSAPNLAGYGSEGWLRGLLADPGGPLYYARRNDMPSFTARLTPEGISDVVAYLQSQAKAR
jgi:mono/diheme cytochrome c family protein